MGPRAAAVAGQRLGGSGRGGRERVRVLSDVDGQVAGRAAAALPAVIMAVILRDSGGGGGQQRPLEPLVEGLLHVLIDISAISRRYLGCISAVSACSTSSSPTPQPGSAKRLTCDDSLQ